LSRYCDTLQKFLIINSKLLTMNDLEFRTESYESEMRHI
jgi:hypothetical protein